MVPIFHSSPQASLKSRLKKRLKLSGSRFFKFSKQLQQHETALVESEQKYQELINLAHEGITVVDRNDVFKFVNKQFAKSLGYSPQELIGKSLNAFVSRESKLKISKETIKRKVGKKSRYEVTLLHKNGTKKYFILSVSPIFKKLHIYDGSLGVYSDITQRRLAEEALKKSEKKYRSIIDQSYIGFIITQKGKIIYANRKFSTMIGVSDPELLEGQIVSKLLTPTFSKRKEKGKMDGNGFFDHAHSSEDEYEKLHKNGRKNYYQTFTNSVVIDGQHVEHTFVIDITEKKLMEIRLEKRAKQIKTLYECSTLARMERPLPSVFSGVVEALAKAFPYYENTQARIRFDKKAYHYPKRLKRFTKKIEFPLEVDGAVRGILEVGYTKNIPELLNDTAMAEEYEITKNVAHMLCKHLYARGIMTRHREIVSKAFTAIVIVQKNIIRYANSRFCTMFKRQESYVIGKSLSHFLPGYEVLDKHCDGKIRECEGYKPGSQMTVMLASLKTTYRGKPAVLVRINDITALKQAQAKLKDFNKELKIQVKEKTRHLEAANKRLHSLNEIKDEFIAVTSHELRSPLTSIRGYLSFLVEEESLEHIMDPHREYLLRAYSTTDSLNYLINNILDVSRLDMGRFELQIQKIDIIKLARDIVDSLAFQVNEKRLELEFDNQTNQQGLYVPIDSIRISQVLRNILDNSIKFTKRGKQIRVTLKKRKKTVKIIISDQGVGIPKAKLKKVFDKFMQVKNLHTKYKGGVGLGLFITKRIVELHDGKIEAYRNEFGGTTISIDLPLINATDDKENH